MASVRRASAADTKLAVQSPVFGVAIEIRDKSTETISLGLLGAVYGFASWRRDLASEKLCGISLEGLFLLKKG